MVSLVASAEHAARRRRDELLLARALPPSRAVGGEARRIGARPRSTAALHAILRDVPLRPLGAPIEQELVALLANATSGIVGRVLRRMPDRGFVIQLRRVLQEHPR